MVVEWIRSKNEEIYKTQMYFKEFFTGVKPSWSARCSLFFNFLRRTAMITICIVVPVETVIKVMIFWLIQLAYFIYNCLMRPLESTRDKVVDVINEAWF